MSRISSILIAGCFVLVPSGAHASGSWASAGSLLVSRSMHGSAALGDGGVIVFGGRGCQGEDTKGPDAANPLTEIFDPAMRAWSAGAPLVVAVDRVVGITLKDGSVLSVGGQATYGLCASRLHEPVPVSQIYASGTWTLTRPMIAPRVGHTVTLLPDGRVLASGGGAPTAEVFDPAAGTWTAAGKMQWNRSSHTATLLPDGRVLIAGGSVGSSPWPSCEIWSPVTNRWSPVATMNVSRAGAGAVLLRDGRVLISGGQTDGGGTTASAEIYDLAADTWTETAPMQQSRGEFISALLPDGRVLVAGGYAIDGGVYTQPTSSEIFDPATDTWSATGSLSTGHENTTFAQLPDGRIVVAGGGYEGEHFTAEAEIFTP